MSRTFTEIITLMQRGAGRFVDEDKLLRFKHEAEIVEMFDGPSKSRPKGRRPEDAPAVRGANIVVIVPARRRLPDNDGSVAYNVALSLPSRGDTLVLCIGSDECDPFWFGLKTYVEWLRHMDAKQVLDPHNGMSLRARRRQLASNDLAYGELVAQALDEELGRVLSKHAPRRVFGSEPNDPKTVIRLSELAYAASEERFPEPASTAEMITRRDLIARAVSSAAHGALALKVA
jgi:hypothetical protein